MAAGSSTYYDIRGANVEPTSSSTMFDIRGADVAPAGSSTIYVLSGANVEPTSSSTMFDPFDTFALLDMSASNSNSIIVTNIIVYLTNVVGLITPPSISIGTNVLVDNNVPETILNLTAVGQSEVLPLALHRNVLKDDDILFAKIHDKAVATTFDLEFIVYGINS